MIENAARRLSSIAAATAVVAALLSTTAWTARAADSESTDVAGLEHVCSSCHGPAGKSVNPTFPNLAGQQKDYIVAQLTAFRDHTRADPHAHTYMWGMAAHLSDATIAGLAAYYSALRPRQGSSENTDDAAGGRTIFEAGDPTRSVPPCMGCHGDKAQGAGPIPRLAGQHRGYLEGQLEAFASNERANAVMHETSKALTAQQIKQVAAYLASQ
jgi:cytochrome c553